jgi:hypothetical protein
MTKDVSILPPQKEMAEIKSQITLVQKAANDLVIETKEDMEKGADLLHNVKQVEDFIIERKEKITRPLMTALASARDLFKPLELAHADAKKVIKAKMLAWQIEEDDRIEKEKERIAKRVEKGTMRADTAAEKLEVVGNVNQKTVGSVGKTSIRVVKKVRIVDESLIPREYMVPDMDEITEAIIRKGMVIPGVETYEEKCIVGR